MELVVTDAVLFKGSKDEDEHDPYIEELQKIGIFASIVPVLFFNNLNESVLQDHLQKAEDHAGIIFTSVRAVEAIYNALKNLPLSCESYISQWFNKRNFSVGVATSNAAKSLLNLNTQGADAGSSENLCKVILNYSFPTSLPFLFPCSSKRKETISRNLAIKDIHVKEIVCYEPVENVDLTIDWRKCLRKRQAIPRFLVFFSPSGVMSAMPMLRHMYSDLSRFHFGAIGPTTRDALLEAGLHVCVVAKNPNPIALAEAFMLHRLQCS